MAVSIEPSCSDGMCSMPADQEDDQAEYKGEWYGEFFPGIPKIHYEGPNSTNPLSFRYYNAKEVVLGKTMAEW